jgi:hypothetical protein
LCPRRAWGLVWIFSNLREAALFTPAAIDIIYKLSGGIPRAINFVNQAALV